MRFSGTIRGLALKLGYVVTLGVSSNFAWFRGFCLKTYFLRFFFHSLFSKNVRWAGAILGFCFSVSLHYTLFHYVMYHCKVLVKSFPAVPFLLLNLVGVRSYGCLNSGLSGLMPIFLQIQLLQ